MNILFHGGAFVLLCVLGVPSRPCPRCTPIAPSKLEARTQRATPVRDGQDDFDFEIGSWKIHLSRLLDRLADPRPWVQFDGASGTRKVGAGGRI